MDGAVILWVHGGGWHSRETTDLSAWERPGLRIEHARFRLSGAARWPAQLDDLRDEAARVRLPGSPLIVAGHSSGGHLALQLGLRGVGRPGDVDAVLAFAPPVDPLAGDWPRARAAGGPWDRLLGHPPAPGDEATTDCTVATHAGGGTPVLLFHGAQDTVVPPTQTLGLAATLSRAGHRVHAMVAEGGHADLDLGREDIAAFVRRFLRS